MDALRVSMFLDVGYTSMFCLWEHASLVHFYDRLMFDECMYLVVHSHV